ncbi:hypothetical protein Rsub_00202 [Raphidocelis subcapitata]|uniref:Leucine zipper transcription factor-like protein 1 n=1 Tax=Raphidocelis subcapitata TaxID=307507 RepID=A0A2V0NJS2_9CHLO|nr:hypothetical protein Rsub_00202 [Raphidocelis subcapitata]|eukprot:GBF87491.1 hypothetical protein Rsub_00202 [Raphidocelis subcapitata]
MAAPPPPAAGLHPQLARFLRFARAKRLQHVRECAVLLDDAAARVAAGDVFSGAEVRTMLAELKSAVEKQVDEEVENAYHSSCLALHLVMQSAEAAGARVELDASALEDARLLLGVRAAEAAAVAGPDLPRGSVRLGALDAAWLSGSGKGGGGAELQQERDALAAELESLRGRFQALQASTTAAMREKSELLRQLEAARGDAAAARREAAERGSAAAGEAAAAAAAEAQKQLAAAHAETRGALDVAEAARAAAAAAEERLAALQQALRRKSGEAAALEAAASERLAASKQFQQLQQLLKSKSQAVTELRRRLAKYEPQEHVESAD